MLVHSSALFLSLSLSLSLSLRHRGPFAATRDLCGSRRSLFVYSHCFCE